MAQFETGYPPLRFSGDKYAYNLGYQLLNLQDHPLIKHKANCGRAMLQLDMPRHLTEFSWLSFVLCEMVRMLGLLTQS